MCVVCIVCDAFDLAKFRTITLNLVTTWFGGGGGGGGTKTGPVGCRPPQAGTRVPGLDTGPDL